MDVVAENFEAEVSKKVEEADGRLKSPCEAPHPDPSPDAAAASSIEAPPFPAPEFSASPPVQFEHHSVGARILAPAAVATTAISTTRAVEMSLAVVDPSTASMNFFSSSPATSSPASSLPNVTPGHVVPPSSSSAMLDLSLAPGNALFTASSFTSPYEGSPTLSPSFPPPPSVSLATTLTPFSSADMIQALSAAPDACSPSQGETPSADIREPVVPSVSAGQNSSGLLMSLSPSLPPSLRAVESPLPLPLKLSSSEGAAMSADSSSFSPIGVVESNLSSVLSTTSAPVDNPSTSLSSNSQPTSRAEFPPAAAPSYSLEEMSALSTPSGSKLDVPTSSETLLLADVPPADPMAPSVLPGGASTGLLTEYERSSLETSTSVRSGNSTITSSSPALISVLPTAFPSRSVCKLSGASYFSSSNHSPIEPKLEPSLVTDPSFAYSLSTSCLALLSSVEKASSRPRVGALQLPTSRVASKSSPSSSSPFNEISPSRMMPVSRLPSLLSAAPSLVFASSGNLAASTPVSTSAISHSLPSLLPSSLNSSPLCHSASGGTPTPSWPSDAMDCSPSLSSHFINMNSNSASSKSNFAPSLLEPRSTKEKQSYNSGPPIVPNSHAFPRRPVRGRQKGEGWPYAPQGWPEHDDKWPWRVGKKVHENRYFKDRILGLPQGLCKGRDVTEFGSKRSIVEYLTQNFPDLCVENFFKSFQWRIPSVSYRNSYSAAASKGHTLKRQKPAEKDTEAHNSAKRFKKECKAGNPNCGLENGTSVLLGDHLGLVCNICCTETGFCRECKCILCCKIIVPEAGEMNFVRCLQRPTGNGMCGHAAHLECAVHSKMAGVVKKRGLDMEYMCRRCDNKTDLKEIVTLLLEALGNTDLRSQAEKSLQLALELMKGTERGGNGARVLESLVQTALSKVQSGVDIREAYRELKEQGSAAEAARQQSLVRASSLVEDTCQQPEASLDQWLNSGSPSSHPSPGTPSSFTSPRIQSNPSVNSGQLNGTQYVDGKPTIADGHTDHFGEPHSSRGVYKNSHLANKPLIRNAGQARGGHRIRTVSSNMNNSGQEAICDSFTARTSGNRMAEPSLRDGNSSQFANHNSNSGTKKQKDQRNPLGGAGMHREETVFTEICRSCGTVRRHTSNALEVTSLRRGPKIEDGGKKVLQSNPLVPREEEPGNSDNYKNVAESDTGVDQSSRPSSTLSANASPRKAIFTSLHQLDAQCEQDVQNALQKLRQSQEAEFEHAKERLNAQRESFVRQYELLEVSQIEFSEQPMSSLEAFDDLLLKTVKQFTKAVQERENFKTMLKVGEGFGSISRDDFSKFYGWLPEK